MASAEPRRHVATSKETVINWGNPLTRDQAYSNANYDFLGESKINLAAKYYYGADQQAEISGVRQQVTMPAFRENFQLGMGINAPMLDVATPCTYTPAVIVVTSIPAMYMRDGAEPTVMGQLTKDLMESHAKSVSGLDFGYTLGVDTSANVGMDSQMFGVPTKTTRNQPSPSFVFTELSGNLVFNWAKKWIWDIQHPDTNASMAQVQFPGAYTMSAYAASFMVIQFDPTMRPDRIIDAAHYVNVFPTATGDIGFERTIGTVKVPERTIAFHAIVQHNPYIKSLAIAMADKLQLHIHNYNVTPPNMLSVDRRLSGLGMEGEAIDRRNGWKLDPALAHNDQPMYNVDFKVPEQEHNVDSNSIGVPTFQ
jgi:hypothetical protein